MRISLIATLILVCVVLVYGFFRSQSFRDGPVITILEPQQTTLSNQVVHVEGIVKNATFLALNDRQIFPDESGMFSTDIALPFGYTTLTLLARNRRGTEAKKEIQIQIQSNGDKENSKKESGEQKK